MVCLPKYQESAAYCHFRREPDTKNGIKCFVVSAVFSADDSLVLTAWGASWGECFQKFIGHADSIQSAVFSADGPSAKMTRTNREFNCKFNYLIFN